MENVEFQIFHFNAKTDYLPYYKKHYLKVEQTQTLRDIFEMIHIDDTVKIEDETLVKINGLKIVNLDANIFALVDILGNDLTLDPVDKFRVTQDFIYNKDSYQEKSNKIACSLSLEEEHRLQKAYYSSALNIEKDDYLGEALFMRAFYRFKRGSLDENEMLELLNTADGIWNCLDTNYFDRDNEYNSDFLDAICFLKNESIKRGLHQQNPAAQQAITYKEELYLDGIVNLDRLDSINKSLKQKLTDALHQTPRNSSTKKCDKLDEVKKLIKISASV